MNIDQTLLQAIEHFQTGNVADALKLCLSVLEQDENNVDALHLAGLLAFQQGQAQTAANLITKAVQIDPAFTDAYINLSDIFIALGRKDDAIACLRKAQQLAPGNAEALARLGGLQAETAAPAPAPAQSSGETTMSIADALDFAVKRHQQGDFSQAEVVYQAVLGTEPNNTDALHLLGVLYVQQSRFDEGIGLIRQAVAIAPNEEMYRNLGQALVSAGRPEEAETAFAKTRELSH